MSDFMEIKDVGGIKEKQTEEKVIPQIYAVQVNKD